MRSRTPIHKFLNMGPKRAFAAMQKELDTQYTILNELQDDLEEYDMSPQVVNQLISQLTETEEYIQDLDDALSELVGGQYV